MTTPSPARGEMRLRVLACGICGSDLHWYQGSSEPPGVCPGHEVVGVVDALGDGVTSFEEGDRVALEGVRSCGRCTACRRGETQLCPELAIVGLAVPGGFADFIVAPERSGHRIPRSVGERAAFLTEPTAVAVHALGRARVRAGQRVAILGAGTIGLLCAAVARRAAADEVIVCARRPQQARAAQAFGAVPVEEGGQALVDACGGGVDVVIETVGGTAGTLETALRCVRPGGVVVVAGVFTEPRSIDALALMNEEVRLVGAMAYGRAAGRSDFEIALDLLRDHGDAWADRLLTHRFGLEAIDRAFQTAAEKREGAIKVVVEPGA